MARIRSIKPEFWHSEQVMACSPLARLLFIGIWNFADDKGRHSASPVTLKAQIFPGDGFSADDIRRMLSELSANGLIEVYEVESKQYLQVTGWRHQKIDHPSPSRLPAPPGDAHRGLADGSSKAHRGLAPDLILPDLTDPTLSDLKKVSALPSHTPPTIPVSPLREESAQGGVREENSQSPAPEKKQPGNDGGHAAYPDAFEGLWEIYRDIANPNSVKGEAFRLWRKLDESERSFCWHGLVVYAIDLQTTRLKRPDAPAKFLETFISKRAWEPLMSETSKAQILKMIEDRHAAK